MATHGAPGVVYANGRHVEAHTSIKNGKTVHYAAGHGKGQSVGGRTFAKKLAAFLGSYDALMKLQEIEFWACRIGQKKFIHRACPTLRMNGAASLKKCISTRGTVKTVAADAFYIMLLGTGNKAEKFQSKKYSITKAWADGQDNYITKVFDAWQHGHLLPTGELDPDRPSSPKDSTHREGVVDPCSFASKAQSKKLMEGKQETIPTRLQDVEGLKYSELSDREESKADPTPSPTPAEMYDPHRDAYWKGHRLKDCSSISRPRPLRCCVCDTSHQNNRKKDRGECETRTPSKEEYIKLLQGEIPSGQYDYTGEFALCICHKSGSTGGIGNEKCMDDAKGPLYVPDPNAAARSIQRFWRAKKGRVEADPDEGADEEEDGAADADEEYDDEYD